MTFSACVAFGAVVCFAGLVLQPFLGDQDAQSCSILNAK